LGILYLGNFVIGNFVTWELCTHWEFCNLGIL
jgi:hypothetical protein